MKPLGELESSVMEIVWAEPGLSVREVTDRLARTRTRAYTTVMTTLDRLHGKGVLARTKDGLAWRYEALLTPAGLEQAIADQLVSELLQAHGEVGLAAFVDAAGTDEALLNRLAELVDEARGTQ